ATIDEAAAHPAVVLVSGPAAGAVGAARVATAAGFPDAIAFDMGGTSTDVALVQGLTPRIGRETKVGDLTVRASSVDIRTVGAGGGSIAHVPQLTRALRVGPQSAGADPGPAAYGKGGTEPTVTDANVVLGYLPSALAGGEITLDAEASRAAVGKIAEAMGLESPEAAAAGIVDIVNENMLGGLRLVSVQQGFDPRDFALVAFGGAGPMHACALAEELEMKTVLVPRASGVLSALGLAVSDVRRDYVRAVVGAEGDVEEAFAELEHRARSDLDSPRLERRADVRYRGQAFELTVSADDMPRLDERFHAAHDRRYGYRMDEEPVDLVNVRVMASVSTEKPVIRERGRSNNAAHESRRASFDGKWVSVAVYDRAALGAGSELTGPAIVELAEATCVVRPGWRGRVDEVGTLVLQR
ncbi:MAG: hydantoinase/oxoprolinase family protein, partial [Actinomycetota bacterium]|nr:hydantoinase/oxoprolinase family protein [Actinomycetota bacterium]